MIAFLIIGATGIAGVIALVRFILLKRAKERYLVAGIVCFVLLGICALQASFMYWEPTFPQWINKNTLKNFAVELETPEQYAQWFRPENDYEYFDAYKYYDDDALTMSKSYSYGEPWKYVHVSVQYFETEEQARKDFEREAGWFRYERSKVKQISPEHEYICSRTTFGINPPCTVIMAGLPDGSLSSEVMVRHKNVIYTFSEQTSWRRSRIDKAVEELWADYLEYVETNGWLR